MSSTLARVSESMMWPSSSTTSRASVISRRLPCRLLAEDGGRWRLAHRHLVGANRGFTAQPAPPGVEDVTEDDLEHTGGRYGEQGAEEAVELDARQHAHQHREG